MSADLPTFRYHPDPLASGSIRESTETCVCCRRLLLGLAIWSALSGRTNGLVRATALGWAFLALPVSLLTDYALLGAGPLGWTAASVLALGASAFTAVACWSERRPRPA
ncbi:CbrC family protein [Streptomyces sclerotialus]|uniref:CbrC family protein n=1 Tax=Streptomyces sclerotialus TaxID=1957 RepID=UPI0004C7F3A4